ncbi:MAG TPA: PEP-CTERM sorting domain-containing protein [Pyrinomonadaceae bacterium]|nr:PEP-CTERM sorting domain-containing protein [Pyrinomonadaceae bacterium]
MFRKALLMAAAVAAVLALGSVARADTVTLTSLSNSTGLTATVSNYSLAGNTFTFTITNTSVAPGPTSVITNIGFDLPGDRPNNYTLVSSTNSSYFILHDLDGGFISNNFDFVLMNRPPSPPDPTQFGVGSIANGIQPGQSATFVISGDFSGLTADEVAHAIYARMQNGTINGSDVVAAPVPEPVTILLFTTGLAGVAARVRRHKADA